MYMYIYNCCRLRRACQQRCLTVVLQKWSGAILIWARLLSLAVNHLVRVQCRRHQVIVQPEQLVSSFRIAIPLCFRFWMYFFKVGNISMNTCASYYDDTFADKGRAKQVDIAPNTTGPLAQARTMRMKWARLHEGYYQPMCKKLNLKPVDYNKFCEIRRQYRPHYIRHRKVGTFMLAIMLILLFRPLSCYLIII